MEETRARPGGRFRPLAHIDIGTVIFFIILIYILVSIALYLMGSRTEVYEVRMGTLSENANYRGIALREEILVDSRYTGTIDYYNREGDRVRAGGLAYSVDEKGEIADYADPNMQAGDFYTERDIETFRADAISFSRRFVPAHFSDVYSFKSAQASQAQKSTGRAILAGIGNLRSTTLHPVRAPQTGVIVYSYDNYMEKTFAGLGKNDFDPSACKTTKLAGQSAVREGSPACRLITDENWSVAIDVGDREAAQRLQKQKYVDVRFRKTGATSRARVETREDGEGNWFANLCFSDSMEAFCADRFLDIQIMAKEKRGLKVPVSSITEGDFFLVPQEYVFEGANGQMGVLLRVYTGNGESGTQFVTAVPYSETEDEYYLDNSVLRDGEILERPNSSDQFTLGKKETLIGVYYINKGYPDFRQVDIAIQDDEYAIVSPGEFYGLQEYDYIVLQADKVRLY